MRNTIIIYGQLSTQTSLGIPYALYNKMFINKAYIKSVHGTIYDAHCRVHWSTCILVSEHRLLVCESDRYKYSCTKRNTTQRRDRTIFNTHTSKSTTSDKTVMICCVEKLAVQLASLCEYCRSVFLYFFYFSIFISVHYRFLFSKILCSIVFYCALFYSFLCDNNNG